MIRATKLLEEFGTEIGMPESRHLEDGIYELRAVQGSDIARCLYFFVIGNKAV